MHPIRRGTRKVGGQAGGRAGASAVALILLASWLAASAASAQGPDPARPLSDATAPYGPAPASAHPPAAPAGPWPRPAGGPAATGDGKDWVLRDRAAVGYEPTAAFALAALAELAASHGGALDRVDARLAFATFAFGGPVPAAFLAEARALPHVRFASLERRVEASFLPNDPLYPDQWGPPAIDLPQAWDATRGSHDVTVAVLDTGIDYTHPDLAPNVCGMGPDFANGDEDSLDDHGHGTHVAGTVAAAIGNAVGVAGMGDSCLLGVKVLDAFGSGSDTAIASAIAWAADHGANVISMSLGGCPGCDPGAPMSDAVAYADSRGVLLVAAAGNAFCAPVGYPAAFPEVLAVSSLDPPDGAARSEFSSCGSDVEIAAPGASVVSTCPAVGEISSPTGYCDLSGTSMATPHVSGVAALVWSAHPLLTAPELRCIVGQTADDLGPAGRDPFFGHGRLNASRALAADACVPTPPAAPLLDGTAGDSLVRLEWTEPSSFGGPVTGYNLYRGTDPDALAPLASLGPFLRYDDLAVTNGVTYHYAIEAVNAIGSGPRSDTIERTPGPLACPAPGPDAFGYTCAGIPFGFVDIEATGTPLFLLDDEVSFPLPIGFTFPYYGEGFDEVSVSSNGFLTFDPFPTDGCCEGGILPDPLPPNGVVAGFWEDLFPADGGSITYGPATVDGASAFLVQFTDVPHCCGGSDRATFQFQLFPDGAIRVQYLDAPSDGGVHAAGIEAPDGAVGLQMALGDARFLHVGVEYAPLPLDGPELVVDAIAIDPAAPLEGDAVTFTATVRNRGLQAAAASALNFTLDGVLHGTVAVPALGPGATAEVSASPWTATMCTHAVVAEADALHEVDEPLEGNNRRSLSFFATPTSPGFLNGDFETGDLCGWTVAGEGFGDWFAYSGTASPLSGHDLPPPPEGSYAAAADQTYVGTQILSQDIDVPAGLDTTLSFFLHYENHASGFYAPPSLSIDDAPNQQLRVDILSPGAPEASVAAGDVLAALFQTLPGDPASLAPTEQTFDLTPFEGQTVRLRFAVVETEFFLLASVDDVRVTSAPTPPGPDLVVDAVTLSPDPPESGGAVTFTATVRNRGTAAAGPSDLLFAVDGGAFDVVAPVGTLAAGASAAVAGAGWTATACSHSVRATADRSGAIVESHEGNNARASFFHVAPAPGDPVNGGFETGDFCGWTALPGAGGGWFVYSGATSPESHQFIAPPPEGDFAATSDQSGPGQNLLLRDLEIPEGADTNLSFLLYYENRAEAFHAPSSLSPDDFPNQQFRVDLLDPSAPVDSLAPGDVLATLFRTLPGDPLSLAPTELSFDLTPFEGQGVRLRFAQVDTEFYFQASVDDVRLDAVMRPAPANSTIEANPSTVTADGADAANVTVQLKDILGHNVSRDGDLVCLASSRGLLSSAAGQGACPAGRVQATDAGHGTYTATLGGTLAGPATVDGLVNGLAIPDTAAVTLVAGPPSAGTSTVAASPATIPADGVAASAVSVRLRDAFGNNATDPDALVCLQTTLGNLTSAAGQGGCPVGQVEAPGAAGLHAATLRGTAAGTATVTARLDGAAVPDNATVTLQPAAPSPTASSVEASPATLAADGAAMGNVTVRLRDAFGNAVPGGGHLVCLASSRGVLVSSTGQGGCTAGRIAADLAGDGTLRAALSGTSAGAASVDATVDGIALAGTATVTFLAGPPDPAASTVSASPNIIPADGATASTLTVRLRDAHGNNATAPAAVVCLRSTLGTLSSTAGPGGCPAGQVQADPAGGGRFTAILRSWTPGTESIVARVDGQALASPASVTLTPAGGGSTGSSGGGPVALPSPSPSPSPSPDPTPPPPPPADSDGDKLDDPTEAARGTDPADPFDPPYAPLEVHAAPDGQGGVRIEWVAPDPRVEAFRVWRMPGTVLVGQVAAGGASNSIVDDGFVAGQSQSYVVESILDRDALPASLEPRAALEGPTLRWSVCQLQPRDSDRDGLCDAREEELRLDPLDADTDDDGVGDLLDSRPVRQRAAEAGGPPAWFWWAAGASVLVLAGLAAGAAWLLRQRARPAGGP